MAPKAKHVLVCITGGIAAYKMCTVVRLLKKEGALVRVVMTPAATQFVAPLTFSALSQEEVTVSLWPPDAHSSTARGVRHIDLGVWADVAIVAPATANTVAKIAHGIADDSVTSIILALRCPLILAPAMDVDMYRHDATQSNIALLRERGCFILPPAEGELVSGLVGPGRLPEPEEIVQCIDAVLKKAPQDLTGQKILVTAGPTYEPIDPVRFVGNRSSGKMGFALANAAAQRGANVTLISGPVALATPRNVRRVNVETAREMAAAVSKHALRADVVIMSAAVADYAPAVSVPKKIKKSKNASSELTLILKPTIDILAGLGTRRSKPFLVGFALETDNALRNAREKLRSKHLNMIVMNSLRDRGAGFGADTNVVTIVQSNGKTEKLPRMSKFDVATEILNRIVRRLE